MRSLILIKIHGLYGVLDYRHMRFGACQELINLVFIAFAADSEHVVKLFG